MVAIEISLLHCLTKFQDFQYKKSNDVQIFKKMGKIYNVTLCMFTTNSILLKNKIKITGTFTNCIHKLSTGLLFVISIIFVYNFF